ncbi:lipopolysaccharide kinase InaA family protein [Salinispirillum sp. LH 10-3-1]|uniref:Lipopolysaccharide kinase InaA family protein n=1 Tax=Salinispirillum sp. LH 10-3-1 TaxID=2952525 RepID=A0AB38YJT8_9GAMM
MQTPYCTDTLTSWLTTLPQQLEAVDSDLIYRLRNRIYRIDDPTQANSAGLCVKAFKAPALARSAYYRKYGSKAARAHHCARRLFEQNAGVAEPIGYIERWDGLRLVESYLITRYLDEATDLYTEMTYLMNEHPDAEIFIRLLRFTANAVRDMHDAGFLHNDLGAQNILMHRDGPTDWSTPVFIDLNRGALYESLTLKQRARDLARLKIPSHFLRIFYHIYFNDGAIPKEFDRWERSYRTRIERHQASRKYRHPIRHIKWLMNPVKHEVSTGKLSDRNAWLWDEKSGQPSVVLQGKDRRAHRTLFDLWPMISSHLKRGPKIIQHYKARKATAFESKLDLKNRLGVCIEVDENIDLQIELLKSTPALPVFVRCYFHKTEAELEQCFATIERLASLGHEVSIGLIQSRQAVLHPEQWQRFMQRVLERTHRFIHFVEVGHAVNRVKWGLWNLEEINRMWDSVAQLKQQYPELNFLGPAVNDFEFHYYPPLLEQTAELVDGIPCHLYVDRRGAPENFQGKFSTLEKCLYGKAIADTYNKPGFYITEINWPLKGTGEYSPLAGAYTRKDYIESDLHVDEETAAAYMIRFALIALCSGTTERIWWWRLAHHGFGLVDDLSGFRQRMGWKALVHFHSLTTQQQFIAREETNGVIQFHFSTFSIAYSMTPQTIAVPERFTHATDLYGDKIESHGQTLALSSHPAYLHYSPKR